MHLITYNNYNTIKTLTLFKSLIINQLDREFTRQTFIQIYSLSLFKHLNLNNNSTMLTTTNTTEIVAIVVIVFYSSSSSIVIVIHQKGSEKLRILGVMHTQIILMLHNEVYTEIIIMRILLLQNRGHTMNTTKGCIFGYNIYRRRRRQISIK